VAINADRQVQAGDDVDGAGNFFLRMGSDTGDGIKTSSSVLPSS